MAFPSFFQHLQPDKIHVCLWEEVALLLHDEQFLLVRNNFFECPDLIDACTRAAGRIKEYADEEGISLPRNLVIGYLIDHFTHVWTQILNSEP